MSKAYDHFLKVYHLSGKEKVDGVYLTDFSAMNPQEFSTAEDMLVNDAIKLDTIAIIGLGVLKSEKAEKTLKTLLKNKLPLSLTHLRIVESLWGITYDIELQNIILKYFYNNDDFLRRQAVIVMEYTTPSPLTYKAFVELLKTEKDSVIRSIASRGILLYFGLMKSPNDDDDYNKFLPLIRRIKRSTNEKALAEAIAEVEKEAAKQKG